MKRKRSVWVAVAVVLLVAVAGIGVWALSRQKSSQKERPQTVDLTGVTLPSWAPKHPSPEFIRAARVLRPIPEELVSRMGSASPAARAAVLRWTSTLAPAYEFFGSLSNTDIARFQSSREVKIHVKSMSALQRRALDGYLDSGREAQGDDLRVTLFREGAKEDLSNVAAGFVSDGHGVNLQFWITRPDGRVSTPSNTVATL